jgi:hypothetical protein
MASRHTSAAESTSPPEEFLAVVRALARRHAREDHACEVARLRAAIEAKDSQG